MLGTDRDLVDRDMRGPCSNREVGVNHRAGHSSMARNQLVLAHLPPPALAEHLQIRWAGMIGPKAMIERAIKLVQAEVIRTSGIRPI